jgi:hypothetical protein
MTRTEEAFWSEVNDCPNCLLTQLFRGLCEQHSQEFEGIVKIQERDPQMPEEDPF